MDTNVLRYTFDPRDEAKHPQGLDLVRSHAEAGTGIVSTQCLQESAGASLRKFAQPPLRVKQALRGFRALDVIAVNADIIDDAVDLHAGPGFHFSDALIVATALAANRDRLYSEDMQHGQIIRGLRLVDPFRAG